MAEWRTEHPDAQTRNAVNDRLIDVYRDPLRVGREGWDHPGVLLAEVPGTDRILIYVVDVGARTICIVSIAQRDPFSL
jgi:hypothetical protein